MADEVPSDRAIVNALTDDLPVGVWVARAPSGEEIYTNRMFGEIMGQSARSDVTVGNYSEPYGILTREGAPYPEERMPFVRALVERQLVVNDDIMIRRPDRTIVHVRAFSRPVMNADGDVTHVVVAFFDITKQVLAEIAQAESERRLQRSQRLEAIGTLAGGIAHDFNNLILGIKLLAHELSEGEADPRRLASLGIIDDLTEKSALLTRSLLGFAGRGRHRAAPVVLDRVLGAMRELFTRTMKGVHVAMELGAGDQTTVLGDPSQLEQVVMNLVVNARDAVTTGKGSRVLVRTRHEGERVVLEVLDDGPGIPAALRERVFEPYFTTKTYGSEKGTGLGLATVFGIVEGHGGTIEILDGLDGEGTTMRLTLPAGPPPGDEAPRARGEPSARGTGTILMVDDDDLVRGALAATLTGLGYRTLEANGAAAAVLAFREHGAEVTAVVLDMVMPGPGSRAVFEAMRAQDPGVVVLLLSGSPMDEDVQALLDAGASGFLMKPCSPKVLAQALAEAQGGRVR
ncbi:MAG: response regulator [Polyangiaceae bacterium]|nr:response regulator [Polyangiaceae bacterium]